jgi:hypothetical protein
MTITGGCLCRAVRYSVSAEVIAPRYCWCRVCQYLAAGSATANLVFPVAAVTVTEPPRDYVSIADSGNRMHRQFCECCGTPVKSASEARPHLKTLRAATLDDPKLAKPSLTIWAGSAPSWACINEDLPSTPRQPAPVGYNALRVSAMRGPPDREEITARFPKEPQTGCGDSSVVRSF